MRKVLPWAVKKPPARITRPPLPVTEYLREVDIFKGLAQEELEALFRGVMVQECVPGTVFFTPEDPTERLFVLKIGQVELYRLTPSGKRLVTRRIGPGTVFGEMGLLGQSMHGCFAEALENSLVCTATRENILRLFQQRPEVGLRMLEPLGSRLKLLEERLEQAVFSPVKVRVANFLLANLDQVTGMVAGFTHAEIGDTIGTLRQTVTQALNEMQGAGLVEVGHKRIRVLDHQGIKQIAVEEQG